MLHQIITTTINGVHITIYETMHEPSFRVAYGLQNKEFRTLQGALAEFYNNIDHALTCAGLLDNEEG